MKNSKFLFGLTAVLLAVAALAVVMTGCPTDNGGGNPFVGTYGGSATVQGGTVYLKAIVEDTTWKFQKATSEGGPYTDDVKGSYTHSGNSATFTLTHSWNSNGDTYDWVVVNNPEYYYVTLNDDGIVTFSLKINQENYSVVLTKE
jgi:hypothetical protein